MSKNSCYKGNSISKLTFLILIFPAKIWKFEIYSFIVCAIKLLCYGLPNVFEFESNHLSNLSCKQKMKYENSNLGFVIGLPLADLPSTYI